MKQHTPNAKQSPFKSDVQADSWPQQQQRNLTWGPFPFAMKTKQNGPSATQFDIQFINLF